MSTDSRPPSALRATRLPPPRLRQASFEDYPQIQRLEAAHAMETLPVPDWRAFWLNNPLWPRVGSDWPIGWVLEDEAGQLVGSLSTIPSLYRFRGQELICANGRGWVVAAEYRAFALWLMSEYFNQERVDLFINTTVGPMAIQALATLSNRVPLGDWQTATYRVTGYRRFAQKALEKMGVPLAGGLASSAAAVLWLKDALFLKPFPTASPSVVHEAASTFDSRFDLFWAERVRQNPEMLLAERDSQSLSWHFAIPMRRGQLWIYTARRNDLLRAYCVLKRQDGKNGLRRMRLIDYQTLETDADLLPGLLQPVVQRCIAEDVYLLEHLGCGLPKMQSLGKFAPYRLKHPNWPFFYHVADPDLGAELRRSEVWDPSGFDGDASFV